MLVRRFQVITSVTLHLFYKFSAYIRTLCIKSRIWLQSRTSYVTREITLLNLLPHQEKSDFIELLLVILLTLPTQATIINQSPMPHE